MFLGKDVRSFININQHEVLTPHTPYQKTPIKIGAL